MATFLVTHRELGDQPELLRPWLAALSAQGITIEACLLLEHADWPVAISAGDRVLALGGDGTQSTVAAVCIEKQAVLGVLPGGTGNDFARALGIPLAPSQASAVIANGREAAVDIGRVNGRPFLNVAHVGLGAQVGLRVPKAVKRRWGPFSYLRHLVSLLFRKRGFWGRVAFNDRILYGRWLEIAVANGPSFGGGHQIRDASHRSGCLTLVCVRARPLPRLFLAWLASRLGRRLNPKVMLFERVTGCQLQTRRRLVISADGEAVGATPMACQIEPARLRVIVPA